MAKPAYGPQGIVWPDDTPPTDNNVWGAIEFAAIKKLADASPVFTCGPPAAGSASGKDKTAVGAMITAALASGYAAPRCRLGPGTYDVGDSTALASLPKYGAGPQLQFEGSHDLGTTLKFSVDRGVGTWAIKGGALETDLYFWRFRHIAIVGPGLPSATKGDPLVNIIGGANTAMAGIWAGSRSRYAHGGVSGFDVGVQIMGNHIAFTEWDCPNNRDNVFWAQAYGNSGDVFFNNCNLSAAERSNMRIANYTLATFTMTKGHLGLCPYPFLFDSGVSGHLSMGGCQLIGTSIEYTGNSYFYSADQTAIINTVQFLQVGNFSRNHASYGILATTNNPAVRVAEFQNVDFYGGMPIGPADGACFDVSSYLSFTSDAWRASYLASVAAGKPWILSTAVPEIRLKEATGDWVAFVSKKLPASTILAGNVLEHNGNATRQIRPWRYYGAAGCGVLAGVALNASTADARECIVVVTRAAQIPVLVDAVTASSFTMVATSNNANPGKATGIVYDGTSTSTSGRPVIGEPYFGAVTVGTVNTHLTIT